VSEFRLDPVTGVWTVVAPERAGRPKDFRRSAAEADADESCPFCGGHERMTPASRFEGFLPGHPSWTTRVFENRFPALTAPDDADGSDSLPAPEPYEACTGFGVHEVVVETPRHGEGLADFTPEHAALVVDTWAERLRKWGTDPRFAAAVVFRNWGLSAGASLAHAHSQIVVLPRVPDALVRELGNFSGAASQGRGCVLCEAIGLDDREGRTVFDDGLTVVQSPYAAPIPYFMRVSPRRCAPSITDCTSEERASLGAALVAAARAVTGVFGDVAFNLVLHVAPYTTRRVPGLPFHWHAEVILRTSDQAGFEWGSGLYTNAVDPDDAARSLREGLARASG
jgi:UDPglucose--hexose-1-phosphate uridylyltransferase